MRPFSAWLATEGEIGADALLGMSPPKLTVKITDPLTEAELRGLFKACQGNTFADRRDEAMVRLMAETGLRAGECASLVVADVDTLHGRAVIRSGKGGRDRAVPFGSQTAAVLDRYVRSRRTHKLAGRPALWLPARAAGSFGYTSLYRGLRRRAELAGIDDFHPPVAAHRGPVAGRRRLRGRADGDGGLAAAPDARPICGGYRRRTRRR